MTDATSSTVTQSPRGAPDFIHELFWGQIRALLGDELERYQPKMGTVSGTTGASLMVIPDGQSVPRKMPHVAGRRFAIGDRVIYGPVKGQPVVIGGVLTATGAAEGVVDSIDLSTQVNNTLVSFQSSITTLTNAVGAKGNSTAATSTGLYNIAYTASEAAATAQTTASNAASAASAAQSAATAADGHAQNVFNQITGMTNLATTTLGIQVGDGEQAHLRLQGNIDPRMDAVCLSVCGNARCQGGASASGRGCNATLTA